MNRAITDTNIILNLAISPSLWFMSNNLLIIKNPIKGFNSKLQVATINMNFDVNENLNKMNTQSTLNTTAKSKPQYIQSWQKVWNNTSKRSNFEYEENDNSMKTKLIFSGTQLLKAILTISISPKLLVFCRITLIFDDCLYSLGH